MIEPAQSSAAQPKSVQLGRSATERDPGGHGSGTQCWDVLGPGEHGAFGGDWVGVNNPLDDGFCRLGA